ncbi:MAG TPA: DNA-processing protein DprA [Candidatus Cybelea sp.]|jgi:DNA processing protein|nr:DNA-processing protein DprA [Candidatus Cybelea sp.]
MAQAMDQPSFEPHARIADARGGRPFEVAAEGLWCAGSLEALARPCVAVVGTRAATPYGRRLAHRFAADLGRSGCCVVSGLALGIDTAAHEGALEAAAPTVGVLGGGHRRFFPPRNRALAERIIAGGGAVLSPYAPDHPAFPHQFLARNGIVAALADAVVVIEAPARSGALNTASWAAGRVPVLAVPGDVDRKHAAGCLALIRDGATLARNAGDVLEAMGRLNLVITPPPAASAPPDPEQASLLRALEHGALDFDALVAVSGLPPAAALCALAVLELDGAIESRGAGTYARVGVLPNGEEHGDEIADRTSHSHP